jgi:hypothetical protein
MTLAIKPDAVSNIEPLNGLAQIGLRGLDQEVVRVGQQRVGMNPHAKAGRQLAEQMDKGVKVSLGLKDPSPLEPLR